ncbi:hypothetical protein F5X99DRAFT_409702 [Biscogniauxia marginata]|nr:hypothetical protein F5X99DRAFT_409702 [Biscogniauxia marginata]
MATTMPSDDGQVDAARDKFQLNWATEELRKYFNHDPSFRVIGGLAVGDGGNVLVEVHQTFSNGYVRPLVVKRVKRDDQSSGLTFERTKCLQREIQALTARPRRRTHRAEGGTESRPASETPLADRSDGSPRSVHCDGEAAARNFGDFDQKLPENFVSPAQPGAMALLHRPACIGMAWPPRRPDNSPTTKEVFGSGEQELLIHLDITPSNIMLDFPDPNDPEHNIVPKLKLIDFGRARLEGAFDPVFKEDVGYQDNVYNIGKIMLALIFKDPYIAIAQAGDVQFQLGDDSSAAAAVRVGWTGRTKPLDEIPGLDRELHALVMLCLAVRPSERPPLETLLAQVQMRSGRTAEFYQSQGAAYHRRETDQFITGLMDRLLLRPGEPLPPDY